MIVATFAVLILFTTKATVDTAECNQALGMKHGKIENEAITASSWKDDDHKPQFARLDSGKAWCSGNETSPYLQISLSEVYKITGIETQGSLSDKQWVTEYEIHYTTNTSGWKVYQASNGKSIFPGNSHSARPSRNDFGVPLVANAIRIYPTKTIALFGGAKRACLRVEIYGCKFEGRNASTCKELYNKGRVEDKAYSLKMDIGTVSTFCQMTGIAGCGGGGWTLVMKIDGSKSTFGYKSSFWSNKQSYNMARGTTGFDYKETKLPSYWNTPFTKICLGMKVGADTKFLLLQKQASSLYSLIADGRHRSTSLGRNAWKRLITGSSLQRNCEKEGFNVKSDTRKDDHARVRIGIIGNQENDCRTPDSFIGFGSSMTVGGRTRYTCGNTASNHNPDNGVKNVRANCYVFVQ